MEWYCWVLIVVGVLGLGYLKLKLFSKMTKKPKNQDHQDED